MKIIRIWFIVIGFSILSCQNQSFENKVWVTAADWTGWISVGAVLDLSYEPYTSYSATYKEDSLPVYIRSDSVYLDDDFLGKVVWYTDKVLAIEPDSFNIKLYHSIPNLNTIDSLDFITDFLVSNPVLFEDDEIVLKVFYSSDTTDLGWNRSTSIDSLYKSGYFRYPPWPGQLGYDCHRKWALTTLNNSVILFHSPTNLADGVLFDVLLITSISNDTLDALKIQVPVQKRIEIMDSIQAGSDFSFDYESCKLVKLIKPSTIEIEKEFELLCSKNWTSSRPDSTNKIGFGTAGYFEPIQLYPRQLESFEYCFHQDMSYIFSVGDSLYKGSFELSRDGRYIFLDKEMQFASCLEIMSISEETLRIQQQVKISHKGRRYNILNFMITFN